VVDRIAADPGFQAERIAELKNDPALPQYREEASGLLASLAEAGLPVLVVQHLYELRVNGEKLDYKAQVPLLVEWLDRTDYFPLMGELVRTLSFAFAKKQARPVFLKLFRDLPELRTAAGHEVTEYDRETCVGRSAWAWPNSPSLRSPTSTWISLRTRSTASRGRNWSARCRS
jgi:hypothetical protein